MFMLEILVPVQEKKNSIKNLKNLEKSRALKLSHEVRLDLLLYNIKIMVKLKKLQNKWMVLNHLGIQKLKSNSVVGKSKRINEKKKKKINNQKEVEEKEEAKEEEDEIEGEVEDEDAQKDKWGIYKIKVTSH